MPAVRNSVRLLAAFCAGGLALIAAGGLAQDGAVPAPPEMRFIAPPFTPAQADAGRGLYRQHCQSCHGSDLGGGSASRPLKGRSFYSHAELINRRTSFLAASFLYSISVMTPNPGVSPASTSLIQFRA